MRRAGWLLACVAVGVAGCGAQHHDSLPSLGTTVIAPPATGTPITDAAALRSRLLTAADLPPGFTALDDGDPGSGTGAPAPDRSRTDPPACSKVLAAVSDQQPGASAAAAVHYTDPNFDSIDIDAAGYPGDGAARAFSTIQALLGSCRGYSGTDADGTALDYQVGGLDQPRTGDASISFQVRTTSQGMTLHSVATVAVLAGTVVQIADTAPRSIDPAALRDLTDKQVRRLSGIAGP